MAVYRPLQFLLSLILVFLLSASSLSAAKIEDLQVVASLSNNGQLQVSETIVYNFEDAKVATVDLFIPTRYSYQDHDFFLAIDKLSVLDSKGKALNFKASAETDHLSLELSDEQRFFSGLVTFRLNYLASGLINYGLDQDLFYWNFTGSSWPIKIKRSQVTINLAKKVVVDSDQLQCFYGPPAKNLKCRAKLIDDQLETASFVFENPFELFVGESSSVTFNLPKGLIEEPNWLDLAKSFFLRNIKLSLSVTAVTLVLLFWLSSRRRPAEF